MFLNCRGVCVSNWLKYYLLLTHLVLLGNTSFSDTHFKSHFNKWLVLESIENWDCIVGVETTNRRSWIHKNNNLKSYHINDSNKGISLISWAEFWHNENSCINSNRQKIFHVLSINKAHGNEEHSGKETTQVKKCHEIKMSSKIQWDGRSLN